MTDFEIIGSTTRDGVLVDEITYDVPGHGTGTGYLLHGEREQPRHLAVATHGERGDRASLLPDLEALAAKGFAGLAIDSPDTRTAIRDRDHLSAFVAELDVARAALAAVSTSPLIDGDHVALLGRGLGAEVAAHLATQVSGCRVVAAAGPLPHRGRFLESDHAIAFGAQLRHGDELAEHVSAFATYDFVASMANSDAIWLVQLADDDDRLSEADRRELAFEIPSAVRLSHHATWSDLGRAGARQERVDLINRLC